MFTSWTIIRSINNYSYTGTKVDTIEITLTKSQDVKHLKDVGHI